MPQKTTKKSAQRQPKSGGRVLGRANELAMNDMGSHRRGEARVARVVRSRERDRARRERLGAQDTVARQEGGASVRQARGGCRRVAQLVVVVGRAPGRGAARPYGAHGTRVARAAPREELALASRVVRAKQGGARTREGARRVTATRPRLARVPALANLVTGITPSWFARAREALRSCSRRRAQREVSMNVESLMRADVRACTPDQTLAAAADVMWRYDCGCVPVVDERGRVVGMVTDRDVCMAALHTRSALHDLRVRDSMSRQVLACRRDDAIGDAARMMRCAQVRRLPVTDDDGRLVGIVSLNDIAMQAERDQRVRRPDVSLADVGLTLSAVGHHRA